MAEEPRHPPPVAVDLGGSAGEAEQTIVGPSETDGAASAPTAGPLPEGVGEYKILAEIAHGGMGVVYRAHHRRLHRDAALKMVLGGRFSSTAARERFRIEAEAAARLDHPAIVPIYEIGEQEGHTYFAMRLFSGGSLADRLHRGPIPLAEAIPLVARIARGIEHAHARGVLHRDLKPANILLDSGGQPAIADFGLAKTVADGPSHVTATGDIVGTPAFMPPEQAAGGGDVTTLSDVYGLGAILYAVLTGRPPHEGDSPLLVLMSVSSEEPPKPRTLNRSIDADLELICLKAIARDPQARYESAGALAADLEAWHAGERISVRPPSVRAQAVRWLRENRRFVYATLALALGMTAAVPLAAIVFLSQSAAFHVYDYFPAEDPPWVVSLARWFRGLGIPQQQFTGTVLLALAVPWPAVAYWTTVVTQPRTARAAFRNGLILGSFLLVFLLLVAGWAIESYSTIQNQTRTVQTLSEAVWPPIPVVADELRERAERTYPGLSDVPRINRATVFANRAFTDAVADIPFRVGVYLTFGTLYMLTIPIGATLAFWMRQRRQYQTAAAVRYLIAWLAALLIIFLTGTLLFRLAFGIVIGPLMGPTAIAAAAAGGIIWLMMRRWEVWPFTACRPAEPAPQTGSWSQDDLPSTVGLSAAAASLNDSPRVESSPRQDG